jgi:hypothetical protein
LLLLKLPSFAVSSQRAILLSGSGTALLSGG